MVKTFTVKGKKYIAKRIVHKDGNDDFKLIPYDEKEYDKLVTDVANKLAKAVNKKNMLKQVLANMDLDDIKNLQKLLKKHKPKARKGCYEIDVGSRTIGLVG